MPEPLVIDESKFIIAPMPGSVVAVSVNVGDRYVSLFMYLCTRDLSTLDMIRSFLEL